MSDSTAAELEAAITLLREALDGRKVLSRYHARALLLPLGVLSRQPETARAALSRVLSLIERDRKGWDEAVADELGMAVAEHVRSADPHYVSRPDYDVRYAREARELLQARLDALAALGGSVAPELLHRIERADRVLAPRLRET